MKTSDLLLAASQYEQGAYSLNEVSRRFQVPRTTLAEKFKALGIEIRANGHLGGEERLSAIVPRICRCGRLAMLHDFICVTCRRYPPCRCPRAPHRTNDGPPQVAGTQLNSGRFYRGIRGGSVFEACMRCDGLIERAS